MKKLVLFFALILGYTAIQAQNTVTLKSIKNNVKKKRIRQEKDPEKSQSWKQKNYEKIKEDILQRENES